MAQAYRVFARELAAYFVSPIAYIVISVFLLVTGWFFFTTFFLFNQASLRNFFGLLPITFSFVAPAVTMRLFSEELSAGSYEILLTLPVTLRDVVLGKFLAAFVFIGAMMIPTISYPICAAFLGDLDWGPVAGGYAGALLLGASFASIGLLASSLTRNQIVAFMVGAAICFGLTLLDRMLFFLPQSFLGFLEYLGAGVHFRNVSRGIIDTRDILYFLSITFIALYGTHLSMKGKN